MVKIVDFLAQQYICFWLGVNCDITSPRRMSVINRVCHGREKGEEELFFMYVVSLPFSITCVI